MVGYIEESSSAKYSGLTMLYRISLMNNVEVKKEETPKVAEVFEAADLLSR